MKGLGWKIIPLKQIADKAMEKCPDILKCLVVRRTNNSVMLKRQRRIYRRYSNDVENIVNQK